MSKTRFQVAKPLLAVAIVAAAGIGLARGNLHAAPGEAHPAPLDLHALMSDPDQARIDYIEQCGGCHGVRGDTVPAHLPELEGRVGWFMCTPEARAYLIRLPNVAHSRIKDNAELADMMNYVVFVLGEGSAPAGTKPFTTEEVAHERQFALTNKNLTAERLRLTTDLVRKCRAPESIKQLYPGEKL
ncbi:hypothetical protein Y88_1303 [Novosphingobium nitrogenifigens DSM 19370]|uniref:Cytochrome c, class I n=1 Tax=Novosphingobium nitrogenifigens DSM 19370 TaxID=983920 RepID=F1Z7Y4_9SPHN|nr:hypothetical protein [Novosphingobium nitrogenifigens]EGD59241.1 hypothetical protein Y88_1303 [Novosphingobium nitrogenifigens DSM 19370]